MRAKYLKTKPAGEPKEISDVLGQVIENAAVGVDVRHADLVSGWEAFSPGDWSLGTAIGVRNGVLLVEVPDGSTASLLKYQIPSLVSAISNEFGDGLVRSVRVKISHE